MADSKTLAALADAISTFGAAATAKLSNPTVSGAPEDQLRAPLEGLLHDLAKLSGLGASDLTLVGESSLSDLKTRPDYAVTRKKALIGFIEVKAPGKGIIPSDFTNEHDQDQWKKLKSLPNLVYTDGNGISLWRDGKKIDVVHFKGDVRTSGKKLEAPPELLRLFNDFLTWTPIAPKSPSQLAQTSARLCRFLRDEVTEQLDRKAKGLSDLKEDWRKLLFPDATNEEFADGYAQAVTFGLLMAKARGISLEKGADTAAKLLRKSNSLIGTALGILTDEAGQEETLKTSLKTLTRVLDVVDWSKISKGEPEAWLYFYEQFLKEYDNDLRKKTGSYYTPPEIVTAMVRLCHEALQSRFSLHQGFASPDVKVADPAVGTGTFLLGVLRKIAETATADGEGMAPGAVEAALERVIGFEIQFGPFAVAQLRLLAEIAELTDHDPAQAIDADLRLYVADTLADPDEETAWIPASLKPIAESRSKANAIKRKEPITVVIGNPPYKDKARGKGGWVEDRGKRQRAPLDDWMPPSEWGVGEHAKHLRNLYIYFWRWATWKVFGGDAFRSGTDKEDATFTNRRGIVCFITASAFLNGKGFQKMRAELRRDADEIWVINCSPEGHQPVISSRLFQAMQQPVCIVLAARLQHEHSDGPARVRFRELPVGHRNAKFKAIAKLDLDDDVWVEASNEWRASFLPAAAEAWASYPPLESLFDYDGSGVMPGRTWIIAPDRDSLERRWDQLIGEKDTNKQAELFKPHQGGDRTVSKVVRDGLHGHEYRKTSVANDTKNVIPPVRYAFRSFDRQWIIPDNRLINRPNPNLWHWYSNRQVHFHALHDRTPQNGPALTITGQLPDLNHYKGNSGGRIFPLWADAEASIPNIRAGLLTELSLLNGEGQDIIAEDVMAYIAAIAAHPRYTERFASDLRQPGLRIPITADANLFREAVALGREVIWLHTFGERFAVPQEGRPAAPPRAENGPTVPKGGAVPSDPEKFPDALSYDAGKQRLFIGEGYIDNVAQAVWAYQVSGMEVIKQWFSYRKKDRSRPLIGDKRPPSPLGDIQPDHWLPEYTSELINVLHVLTRLVALEPAQDDLLSRIVEGPTHSREALSSVLRADS